MTTLFSRDNDAVDVNPSTGLDFALSRNGSSWLWAVTAVHIVGLLTVAALTYLGSRKASRLGGPHSNTTTTTGNTGVARSGDRVFHYLFAISLFVGSVAYFTIASNLGWTGVATTTRTPGIRQVFYARYINWFVGWTPLVIALGIASGVSWATILYNIALLWIWIATWLSGALVSTSYKFGYFAFGLVAYFLLAFSLFRNGGVTAKRVGISSHYNFLTAWVVGLWLIYPIAWGLDEGNVISVTSAHIFWGILDLLVVPVTIAVFLVLSRKWDYGALNIHFTQYGRVAQQAGTFNEKYNHGATAGTTTGATGHHGHTGAHTGANTDGYTGINHDTAGVPAGGAPVGNSAVGNNVV